MNLRTLSSTLFAAFLLGGMFTLLVTSARGESQTVDEGAHLAAGYSYWKTGDFRLNPEHPPLVKLLASVPLLFVPIHFPADAVLWEEANQWGFARALLYENTLSPDTLLFLGRLLPMLVGVLTALFVYWWSRSLWGSVGGLLSLAVFAFDPNVLAHARYVTTDIGVTLLFVLTIFFFGRFLDHPSSAKAVPVILSFSLANLAKFSAVLLLPILFLLWALKYLHTDERLRAALSPKKALLVLLALPLATWFLAFVLYGFELRRPISDPQVAQTYATGELWQENRFEDLPKFTELLLRTTDPETAFGKATRWFFSTVPLPAYSYLKGLSDVAWHNYWGHDTYLMGTYSTKGWWYYFPIAFLVKTPFSTLILLILVLLFLVRLSRFRFATYGRRNQESSSWWQRVLQTYRSADFMYVLLLVPALAYLLLSMTSHINLGVRHLMPVFPFIAVLIGNLSAVRFRKLQRLWQISLYGIVALLITSSLLIYPYYLAFFSELVGGANYGARYLVDSNLDWGQELKRLGRYMDEHNIPFVYITYFGQAPLETYLSDFRYLPTTDEPEAIHALDGWAAISATVLFAKGDEYAWLRGRRPTTKIGYAIFLYDLRKSASVSSAATAGQ